MTQTFHAVTDTPAATYTAAAVIRGRRDLWIAALVLAVALVLAFGPRAELSASIVTALGCMAAGDALTRLIPRRWLFAGVVAMACVDVLLLAVINMVPSTPPVALTFVIVLGRERAASRRTRRGAARAPARATSTTSGARSQPLGVT